MSAVKIGDSNLIFGVSDQSYGYFENLELNNKVDKTEVRNGAGDVQGVVYFGEVFEVSGTYVFKGTSGAPDVQDNITINYTADADFPLSSSNKIRIDEVKRSYKKSEPKIIEFSGVYYPGIDD